MKKHPHIHDIIDTAAIWARVEQLCALVPILLARPSTRGLLANSVRLQRAVRELVAGCLSNEKRELKLQMLSHGPWRARVLRELGGAKALAKWGARWAGYELRLAQEKEKSKTESKEDPAPSVWRKTPERALEEERQKAHARKCAKACAHPRIIRDPFKVDGDGLFRLAPVPRLVGPRRESACIPFDIMDYDYNGERMAKLTGADAPIMLWPVEFEMAEELEGEIILGREVATDSCHSDTARSADATYALSSQQNENSPMGDKARHGYRQSFGLRRYDEGGEVSASHEEPS